MSAFDHTIDPMSGRQYPDASERTLTGTREGVTTRPTPSPVTRAEVEAAVRDYKDACVSRLMGDDDAQRYRWALDSLITRLFAERDARTSERDDAVAALDTLRKGCHWHVGYATATGYARVESLRVMVDAADAALAKIGGAA